MGTWQAYRMAIKSILSNKIRSFLTMLGVIIGVGAVITAVAFAQGSTKSITDQLTSLGTNLIRVNIRARNSNRDVKYADLADFSSQNLDIISAIAPSISGNVTLKYGTIIKDTSLIGTTPDYALINKRSIQSGRYILSIDNDLRQKTAVIGSAVKNELFPDTEPLDKSIKINGEIFKVIGVLEEVADGVDGTDDDQVIIPVATAQRLMKNSRISNYTILATTAESVDLAMVKLEEFLLKFYSDSNSFNIFNSAQMLDTLGSITGIMMGVLGGIATISLVVGGIGIMNIMLVSVTERTREIGIRKAIGAKRKNILVQFLIEAVMVTGIGGIAGIILGVCAITIIGKMGLVPAVYSPIWIFVSFGISLIVGVVFGMFPANKAARLNPIEALRYE